MSSAPDNSNNNGSSGGGGGGGDGGDGADGRGDGGRSAGGDPTVIRLSPGQTSYDAITLEAGVTHDPTFELWANKVWGYSLSTKGSNDVSLKDFRKDIIIEVYNEAGQKAIAYNVYRCWPSAFQALPDLNGTGNDTAITILTLQNEGWERDATVKEPTEESYTLPSS